MLGPSLIATIRTLVPAAVGTVIAFLVGRGLEIDPATQEALTTGIVSLSIAGYYLLVTTLERKVDPRLGWLLGLPAAPSYDRGVDQAAVNAEVPEVDFADSLEEDPQAFDEYVDPDAPPTP